jgi:hypothetical protein
MVRLLDRAVAAPPVNADIMMIDAVISSLDIDGRKTKTYADHNKHERLLPTKKRIKPIWGTAL